MPSDRTRKIVMAGVLGAIAAFLGWTRLGFIPWFTGASLTIMHVPVIIGAILEGPVVGAAIGLIFGGFSMLQAAIAPTGPTDVWFVNPLLAVVPRLAIGPAAWGAHRLLARRPKWVLVLGVVVAPLIVLALLQIFMESQEYQFSFALLLLLVEHALLVGLVWLTIQERPETALIGAGVVGSLTNTVLVLSVIGLLGFLPWQALPPIAFLNGVPEAVASAIITVAVVAAWRRIETGSQEGSRV